VNFSKLDAALAAALTRKATQLFHVHVHFKEPLTDAEADLLQSIGLAGCRGETIVNGSLPEQKIEKLSNLPSVGSITLSGSRRLL